MSVKSVLPKEILDLPVSERLKLVEAIWESIAATPEQLPLSNEHIIELDRRLIEYEKNREAGSSWEEVKERILKRN